MRNHSAKKPSARWIITTSFVACCSALLLGNLPFQRTYPAHAMGGLSSPSPVHTLIHTSARPPASDIAGHRLNPRPRVPEGKPAIRPSTTAAPWQSAKVTLTSEDVSIYASAHEVPYNRAGASHASVISVRLMTSREAARVLDEPTGLPDTEPVFYVLLRGTFSFAAESGSELTYSHSFELFDARTGNLLIWGGLP